MGRPWRLEEWQKQAICDAMEAGEKREAIAAEFGVTPRYTRLLARRRGVRERPAGRPRKIRNTLLEPC